jgi:hypothetical protein
VAEMRYPSFKEKKFGTQAKLIETEKIPKVSLKLEGNFVAVFMKIRAISEEKLVVISNEI